MSPIRESNLLVASLMLALFVAMSSHGSTGTDSVFDLDYVMYNVIEDGGNASIGVYMVSGGDLEQAELFIEDWFGVDYEGYDWCPVMPGEELTVALRAVEMEDNTSVPLRTGTVRLFPVPYGQDNTTANVFIDGNLNAYLWEGELGSEGTTTVTMRAARSPHPFHLVMELVDEGGDGNRTIIHSQAVDIHPDNPEMDMDYVVYSIEDGPGGSTCYIRHHTFSQEDRAIEFLEAHERLLPQNYSFSRDYLVKDQRQYLMAYSHLKYQREDIWRPNSGGLMNIRITSLPSGPSGAGSVIWSREGLILDEDGIIEMLFKGPDNLGAHQLFFECSGKWDPILYLAQWDALWNFTCAPPMEIQVVEVELGPVPVRTGEAMTVRGQIRYNFTGLPVRYAEVTVSGPFVGTFHRITDAEGRFEVVLEAPLQVMGYATLNIHAVDPATDERATHVISYHVEPSLPPPGDDDPSLLGDRGLVVLAILFTAVIAVVISLVLRRRHKARV